MCPGLQAGQFYGRFALSTGKPYWAKSRSNVKAVPTFRRSMTTKLIASLKEKSLSP